MAEDMDQAAFMTGGEFDSVNEFQPQAFRLRPRLPQAGHGVVVGEGDRLQPRLPRPRHHAAGRVTTVRCVRVQMKVRGESVFLAGGEGGRHDPAPFDGDDPRPGGLRLEKVGAGDGIRTHDVQLGKLTFYP